MNLDEYVAQHGQGKPLTFGQYERYISGWQATKPWHWKGCSIAYFDWAQDKHDSGQCTNPETLRECWALGMGLRAKSLREDDWGRDDWIKHATTEQLADFIMGMGLHEKDNL
jgi:hypothetical protein